MADQQQVGTAGAGARSLTGCRALIAALVLVAATAAAQPVPTATGSDPGSVFQGEGFSSQVCFDNTGTATGYSPAVALIVPPGVAFVSATFSGGPVVTNVVTTCTQPAGCTVTDPDSGQMIALQDGETLILIAYPIGSVPTEMPELCLDLQFTLAGPPDSTVGQPIDIGVIPIFTMGADPTDNPTTDPPIPGPRVDLTVVPSVLRASKSMSAPEGETATGPNYPIPVTIDVEIASAQTVNDLTITDTLPPTLQFVAFTDTAGCTPTLTPSTTTAGGELELEQPGTAAARSPSPIASSCRRTTPEGIPSWPRPASRRAPSATTAWCQAPSTTTPTRSRPTSRSPRTGRRPTPGDTLTYTLTMDVSDFVTLRMVTFTDTLGGCADVRPVVRAHVRGHRERRRHQRDVRARLHVHRVGEEHGRADHGRLRPVERNGRGGPGR